MGDSFFWILLPVSLSLSKSSISWPAVRSKMRLSKGEIFHRSPKMNEYNSGPVERRLKTDPLEKISWLANKLMKGK